MVDLVKSSDETLRQYIARIGAAKDNGELDMTWDDLVPILNEQTGESFAEGTYRQKWIEGKKWYDEVFSKREPDTYLAELKEEKERIFKAKRQFLDQRREYNKLLTADARSEHLREVIENVAREMNEKFPLIALKSDSGIAGEKVGVLFLSDWHYGANSENLWNEYSVEICKRRIQDVVLKTKRYLTFHNIRKLYIVVLGDLIHGAIHTTARVASEEDTSDQLIHASELLAEVVDALSQEVDTVDVYSTYGNHARSVQDKKESIHSDNMEKIVPWWLKWRLAKNEKVVVHESEYYEFLLLQLFGRNIVCTHGDLDKFKDFGTTINSIFTKKFGLSIDYTVTADKHHLEEFEQFGIESILVRSLCGTDEYANGKRLYSLPGQTFMVFSEEDGRECTYNIVLS